MCRSRLLWAILMLLAVGVASAQERVDAVRMWPAPDSTRLVFDLSGPVKHKLFTLPNPDRVVIDIADCNLKATLPDSAGSGLLKGVRAGVRKGDDLRIVLDLQGKTRAKSFTLRPNDRYGHRLVIDLEQSGDTAPVRTLDQLGRGREVVIAIDAGHGGEDPGALGPTGLREKDAVMGIARELREMVSRESGMQAVMIREGDYYVGLRKRVEKAREHRADLFVSIHADAFRDARAYGSSVYVLSRRGASSEQARLLAEKENASDLVGGVTLDDKDDLLASVLLDLSQTATNEASYEAASEVLKRLKGVSRLHKRQVEQAAFRVLKSPDIPSLLVETAFISNPQEEQALRSAAYQRKMAAAIMDGIRTYFQGNPPPGTLLAQRRTHVVARGDTLSGIAQQYRVSMEAIRDFNGLQTSELMVGDTLQIPGGS